MVSIPKYVGPHRYSPPRRPRPLYLGVAAEACLKVTVADGGVKGRLCRTSKTRMTLLSPQKINRTFSFAASGFLLDVLDVQNQQCLWLWLQLTRVCAAKLWRKGNVINCNASASRTVEGHFKDHLERQTDTWRQALVNKAACYYVHTDVYLQSGRCTTRV